MESYSLSALTKKLLDSDLTVITSKTLKDLLEIENERTYYRIVNDFVRNNILQNLERNKYYVVGREINTFEMANFLYQPSYISLETALNYWGILPQFPFEVTSVTLKKGVTKNIEGKVYSYSHIVSKYFGMFIKKDGVLIAQPEKAFFDQIYFASKGLKAINFDEYDLKNINTAKLLKICRQLRADKKITNLVERIIK